jgi:hypothetical protein
MVPPERGRGDVVGRIAILSSGRLVGLFALGWSVGWVSRGFTERAAVDKTNASGNQGVAAEPLGHVTER